MAARKRPARAKSALRAAHHALKASERALEAELADMRVLQDLSAELTRGEDATRLYEKIIDAAVTLTRADFASMQRYDAERGELELLAFRNFHPESARFWTWVRPDAASTCGAALRLHQRVVAVDVEKDEHTAHGADLEFFRRSGIRACQTTPLFTRSGELVGMLSTHWRRVHRPSNRDLGLLDILGRQAADLVERARTLRAITESEARARIALDLAGQGTWGWNVESGEIEVDDRCREICGLAPDTDLTGAALLPRIHADDLPRLRAALDRATNPDGDGTLSEEFRVNHPRDGERWVAVRALLPFAANPRPRPLVMLGTMLDVTQRRRIEQELRDNDRRKDEFLATLAHELRNPLAPLCNGLQVLRLGGEPDALHQMMERQARHMVRLVDDLLEVSRISRGKIELRRERVQLGALLAQVIETSRPLLEDSAHVLHVEMPGAAVWLEADPVRLAQVFSNLINNAGKFTPAGGEIRVRAWTEADTAIVSVRDTGAGIPAPMLTRVFDLFTQLDSTRDQSNGGLGIGLSLARSLVELHGGHIEARSEGAGKGSEFVVRLPVQPGSEAAEPLPAAAVATGSLRGPRVLIVDDNRDAADSLGMLLEQMGAQVKVVHSGESAVAALAGPEPQAVLLDLGMPEVDGFEVARQVRARCSDRVTLIALSGWGQDEDRRRTREAGFNHHLVKPPDPATLQALLSSL